MNPRSGARVLFLGRNDAGFHHCQDALEFTREHFENLDVCLGSWGQPLPETARNWTGDFIISYLSRWVVPPSLLARAKQAAINFHPASPEFPGIGCVNFALYQGAAEYGATCHHMAPQVDSGGIVAVRRFAIQADDNVESLLQRTYDQMFELFQDVVGRLKRGEPLPRNNERWTRSPFTRKEFEELNRLTPEMSEAELRRRIRATTFGKWAPSLEINGVRFTPAEDSKK